MSFEKPKIVVVGAGAMGGLFGGLLAEGGLDVTLVDAWPEHIAAIKQPTAFASSASAATAPSRSARPQMRPT